MKNKNILIIAVATACLLLVPLLGGAPWTLFDFIVGGTLLFGTGLTFELVARKGGTTAYRAAVGIACATALLLVWLNLAVGLIGSEGHPANLMYVGVLAVGVSGAFLSRFQPRGMARALFATALAQALAAAIALIAGWGGAESPPLEILGGNGIFVALWAVSGLLFRHAGRPWAEIPRNERSLGTGRGVAD